MEPVSGLGRRLSTLGAGAGVSLLILAGAAALLHRAGAQLTGYGVLIGLALIVSAVALDPEPLLEAVRSPRARSGAASAIVTAVALGAILALNTAASGWTAAWDLTQARLFTLAPQSVVITRRLTSDLTATGFYTPAEATNQEQMAQLLDLYRAQSAHVKVRFLDPNSNPVLASQLGAGTAGDLVLQYKNRAPQVLALSAQTQSDITSAIQRLESTQPVNICWEVGEGERSLSDSTDPGGYAQAAGVLQQDNFSLTNVVLSQNPSIPASCQVLALVGSLKPFPAPALSAIAAYLGRGGKLLLAFDPWVSSDNQALDSVNSLLKPYGYSFSGGLVEEGDANHMAVQDPTTPVAFNFGASPIGKALGGQYVFMPQPTAIVGVAPNGVTAVPFITTTGSAFEIQTPRNQLARQAGDGGGPFTLMETLTQPASGGQTTRIALVGTSAFAENRALPPNAGGANDALLRATFEWLSEQDALISASPQPVTNPVLSLTEGQLEFNYVLTLGLLPLLVLVAGLMVWYRRRSRSLV
ncbi:MAG TPA: GldG family protein [Candidatus Nitrosotalea sp.]|nr:GldG family protein [Candidatus Nitrosotalea sp.]